MFRCSNFVLAKAMILNDQYLYFRQFRQYLGRGPLESNNHSIKPARKTSVNDQILARGMLVTKEHATRFATRGF
jgi:hypothetical protein